MKKVCIKPKTKGLEDLNLRNKWKQVSKNKASLNKLQYFKKPTTKSFPGTSDKSKKNLDSQQIFWQEKKYVNGTISTLKPQKKDRNNMTPILCTGSLTLDRRGTRVWARRKSKYPLTVLELSLRRRRKGRSTLTAEDGPWPVRNLTSVS